MIATTNHSLAIACELVRTTLASLDHALDQDHDPATIGSAYVSLRALEKELHQLTDRAGRLLEFQQTGPR